MWPKKRGLSALGTSIPCVVRTLVRAFNVERAWQRIYRTAEAVRILIYYDMTAPRDKRCEIFFGGEMGEKKQWARENAVQDGNAWTFYELEGDDSGDD